jgi:hypothetical protein
MGKKSRAKKERKKAKARKKTGNAFIDAIHEAQDAEQKDNTREVRVVVHDGHMAVKPVIREKQNG